MKKYIQNDLKPAPTPNLFPTPQINIDGFENPIQISV